MLGGNKSLGKSAWREQVKGKRVWQEQLVGRNNHLAQEGWAGTILYGKRCGQEQSSLAREVGRNNPLGQEV
jgi:hypothetical protein